MERLAERRRAGLDDPFGPLVTKVSKMRWDRCVELTMTNESSALELITARMTSRERIVIVPSQIFSTIPSRRHLQTNLMSLSRGLHGVYAPSESILLHIPFSSKGRHTLLHARTHVLRCERFYNRSQHPQPRLFFLSRNSAFVSTEQTRNAKHEMRQRTIDQTHFCEFRNMHLALFQKPLPSFDRPHLRVRSRHREALAQVPYRCECRMQSRDIEHLRNVAHAGAR